MTIAIAAIICSALTGFSQDFKVPVTNAKDSKLVLKDFNGKLPVTSYNGTDIVITAVDFDNPAPERSKGLKAVYPGGTDNTGIGLDLEKEGNLIIVKCLIPFTRSSEYKIMVPENLALKIESSCERSLEPQIEKVKGEIEINTCHNISLKDVSGPVVLSTIDGNIDITFSGMVTDKPFSVNSISGEIDITMPAKTATSLEMSTVTGTVYSDFDFTDATKKMKQIGGNQLNYDLNGGGVKFRIATVSGNIYLRKGN